MGVISINAGNIYPTANDGLAEQYTGGGPAPAAEAVAMGGGTSGDDQVRRALTIGGQASPLIGLLVFGGLTVGIMLIANNVGEAGEFSNLRASAYNIALISLIATAGIPLWKFVFTKWPVAGVSTWVQAV